MTNETKMPELFSPYHDGSMQLDTDDWYECGWGQVYLDDYKDLSDAKDKRIAELKAKLAKAVEALGGMIGLFSVDNVLRKGTHLNIELSHARTTLAELTKERSDEKGETE